LINLKRGKREWMGVCGNEVESTLFIGKLLEAEQLPEIMTLKLSGS